MANLVLATRICTGLRLFVIFSLIIFPFNIISVSGSTQLYMHSGVQLSQYNSYASVQMLEYRIGPQTQISEWIFIASRENENECAVRKALVYIQQGSFPLITPENETFPDHFNTDRSSIYQLELSTNKESLYFSIRQPLPGSWFAAVLLGDKDNRFQVKDLAPNCRHFIRGSQRLILVDDIEVIKKESLTSVNVSSLTLEPNKYYRFEASDSALSYQITVQDCKCEIVSSNSTDNHTCEATVLASGLALPGEKSDRLNFTCSPGEVADLVSINVTHPAAGAWNYLLATLSSPNASLSFTMLIKEEACPSAVITSSSSSESTQGIPSQETNTKVYQDINNQTSPDIITTIQESNNNNTAKLRINSNSGKESMCEALPELGQFVSMGQSFMYKYNLHFGGVPFYNGFGIETGKPVVLKFNVIPLVDTGGTIKFVVRLDKDLQKPYLDPVKLNACLTRHSIPLKDGRVSCPASNRLSVNKTGTEVFMFIPYPEAGAWYIAIEAVCFALEITDHKGGFKYVEVPCKHNFTQVSFSIVSNPCVENSCANHGQCVEYMSGVYHFSVCRCRGGWRGYGCTDGTKVEPKWSQLRSVLLLTMSNLAFFPAVLLALYRRYYVEALVYFYTMFFSSFYHACDTNNQFSLCIIPYNVLQFCDFFGSILSFWTTIIAVTRFPVQYKSLAFAAGALIVAMGVQWAKHSLYVFMIPTAIGLGLVLISWTYRCYRRRQCYPGKKRWVLFLVPGAVVAIVGLVIFAFVETTSNYQFTHSAWHACMAVAILFFLPPREKSNVKSIDDEDVVLVPVNHASSYDVRL